AEYHMPYADVHGAMASAMKQAKAAYGQKYVFAGPHGIHPTDNGHLVMAYAFLKAMGLPGEIGTITVDYAAGKAQATAGHKVISAGKGLVELQSSRWPFCFEQTPRPSGGATDVLPFVPFQQDLNRFMLVVRDLPGAKATITWGRHSKVFTAKQLAAGVNLAAEFPDNPFSPAFRKLAALVARKQNFETQLIKGVISNFRRLAVAGAAGKDVAEVLAQTRSRLLAIQEKLADQAAAAVVPVRHRIVITPADWRSRGASSRRLAAGTCGGDFRRCAEPAPAAGRNPRAHVANRVVVSRLAQRRLDGRMIIEPEGKVCIQPRRALGQLRPSFLQVE
ncbi:MAG: hypothetical protein J7M21_01400, partial [Planctomycetes bacterium]|nr:hypothetical protein [Planctomycetota bacterium]